MKIVFYDRNMQNIGRTKISLDSLVVDDIESIRSFTNPVLVISSSGQQYSVRNISVGKEKDCVFVYMDKIN